MKVRTIAMPTGPLTQEQTTTEHHMSDMLIPEVSEFNTKQTIKSQSPRYKSWDKNHKFVFEIGVIVLVDFNIYKR